MTPPFRIELLAKSPDRTAFACGEESLDRHFRTQVTQDARRIITTCFVAVESSSGTVAAYYTLAATGISTVDLPPKLTRKLPRYPSIPAVLVGRLAVDRRFRGRGLGAALLADAASRMLAAALAAFALMAEAKNENAVAFYEHHGFSRFESRSDKLFLPLATAAKVL